MGLLTCLPQADFGTKRRELWEARSVPPWFSCDHRLGCLSITLTPNSAFCAEEYAMNVGFGDVAEDLKVRRYCQYGFLIRVGRIHHGMYGPA